MTTAVYVRISEDREGRELGVDRQRADCMALAARLGYADVEVYADNDRSASTRSRKGRPEYQRLLADARAGRISMVIAYTSGRLTRRPREHEDLLELAEQRGVQFRYVASPAFDLNTSAGRRVARILAANDAGEAEDIAERVKREVRQRAEQGRYAGGPRAYGYAADGMALVEDEAAHVRTWSGQLLAGRSISSIAREAGKHHSSIRVILQNPRNAGLRVLDGVQYPGAWPAIVPEDTWRAVVALLTDPDRRTNTGRTARRWLGSGLYQCERCDGRPVAASFAGHANHGRHTYACMSTRGGCSRSWSAAPLDAWVVELVTARLRRGDLADLLPRDRPDVDALRAERVAARARLDAMAVEFADGELTASQLRAATERLRGRLAELDAVLTDAGRVGPLGSLVAADDPGAAWLAIPVEDVARRQAVVRSLLTVNLGAPLRGRTRWDADRFIRVEWL